MPSNIPLNNLLQSSVAPIGSDNDLYRRLLTQLADWFGNVGSHPVLDVVLEAFINTGTFHYTQYQYVVLQTRIKTATDDNLDQISKDFLGDELPRRGDESDDSYRNRILATILQEKATRYGMSNALYILTGYYPLIFEPWNSVDAGACNSTAYCNISYCGSGSYPYQCFIDVYVSGYTGMGNYGGCNTNVMGCNIIDVNARNWCGGGSLDSTPISDDDIYKLINLTKQEGTICWVKIIRG